MIYQIIIIMFSFPYIIIKTKKNNQIVQQNFYNENNRYLNWGTRNLSKVFDKYDLLMCLINFINLFLKSKILIFINVGYILIYFNKSKKIKKESVKIPLKVTNRVKRIFTTMIIIFISLLMYMVFNYEKYIFYFIYSITILLDFYILFLVVLINYPIELMIYLYYFYKTKKKLKALNNLEIVGITGSYGKTSSKNILNEVLGVKYNSVATPKNYNTKYGVMMTINDKINKFNEIFIVEIGAYKLGSIKSFEILRF